MDGDLVDTMKRDLVDLASLLRNVMPTLAGMGMTVRDADAGFIMALMENQDDGPRGRLDVLIATARIKLAELDKALAIYDDELRIQWQTIKRKPRE